MHSSEERVLTTGEIAAYCKVHLRTVIRWIDKGRLKAYKLPGRGNNRIREKDFLEFLTQYNMPIPSDLQKKPAEARRCVLVVDDDVNMAKSIQRILRQAGCDTHLAHDGFQAGVMLADVKPDLLTLDLSMPKMDGFSVLQFIRDQEAFQTLNIVVISALDQDALDRALALGAQRCLSKPFQNQTLLSIVDELCSE